ncbi:MAG: LysE family translocator [Proteobacteria bacterium]|nr:LysE family translocator [Pseudomonadota bacterium]
MNSGSIVTLFATMFALAIIPGPGVFAVVARSLASGLSHGFITVIGIVSGDFIFILLAVYSLSTIDVILEDQFDIIKYIGGGYLIWLGASMAFNTLKTRTEPADINGVIEPSWLSNFSCGLFITLSDPKAILFYMSFLPAFVDIKTLSFIDTVIILMTALIAVGSAKFGYAYMADRSRRLFKNERARKTLNAVSAAVMIGTGIFLILKQ